ncbi:YigZ family protein [Aeromonas dhakensis]|uniref:YigZ family protein n=1 Tax=Aeromonas dhakensis TaxID=196024 RepID=UPI00029A6EFD|nr:YigZ family protein [Aeromonas dhakensis]AHV37144.1 GTP-binding protein [Aeromonas hydrophila YL17]BEJ51612.1 YigZ family protein [Aeromonas dhakensis]
MAADYSIPAASLEVSEEIKKSRFITYLAHTPTVEAAKAWIGDIKQQHPGARHHCWAFVAGAPQDSQVYGFSDDGEPSGSAGKPMLAQLMGSGLGEIAAVVVRYYGGVLLGTGGLVKAYGGGVGAALRQLETRIKRQQTASLIQCDYADMGAVEALIQAHKGQLLTADYGASVTLQVAWESTLWVCIAQELTDRTQGRVSLRPLDG